MTSYAALLHAHTQRRPLLTPTLYVAATAKGLNYCRRRCLARGVQLRAPTAAADAARHAATAWFVEEWAPAMAYPWRPQDMHLNITIDHGLGIQ